MSISKHLKEHIALNTPSAVTNPDGSVSLVVNSTNVRLYEQYVVSAKAGAYSIPSNVSGTPQVVDMSTTLIDTHSLVDLANNRILNPFYGSDPGFVRFTLNAAINQVAEPPANLIALGVSLMGWTGAVWVSAVDSTANLSITRASPVLDAELVADQIQYTSPITPLLNSFQYIAVFLTHSNGYTATPMSISAAALSVELLR